MSGDIGNQLRLLKNNFLVPQSQRARVGPNGPILQECALHQVRPTFYIIINCRRQSFLTLGKKVSTRTGILICRVWQCMRVRIRKILAHQSIAWISHKKYLARIRESSRILKTRRHVSESAIHIPRTKNALHGGFVYPRTNIYIVLEKRTCNIDERGRICSCKRLADFIEQRASALPNAKDEEWSSPAVLVNVEFDGDVPWNVHCDPHDLKHSH